MTKPKRPVLVEPAYAEHLALLLAQHLGHNNEHEDVTIPYALGERILSYLRPFGDFPLSDFGHLTELETELVKILMDAAPRFAALDSILAILDKNGFTMSVESLMVNKRRLLVKLFALNDSRRAKNELRTDEEKKPYIYLLSMSGAGYALARSMEYHDESDLKNLPFGVSH
ncbi:MAG: hypothetical protein WBD37_11450 [Anderseniella sp.]